MDLKNVFSLTLIVLFFTAAVHAETQYPNGIRLTNYSIYYTTESWIFGLHYYSNIEYTIINEYDYGRFLMLEFYDDKNKLLKEEKIFIGGNSSFNGRTEILTGVFFYVTLRKYEGEIKLKIVDT